MEYVAGETTLEKPQMITKVYIFYHALLFTAARMSQRQEFVNITTHAIITVVDHFVEDVITATSKASLYLNVFLILNAPTS